MTATTYGDALRKAVASADVDALWTLVQRHGSANRSTHDQYIRAWRQWLDYCSERGVDPVMPPRSADQDFLDGLVAEGLAPRTAHVRKAAMRKLFSVFDRHGLVTRPFENVDIGPFDLDARPTYTVAELERLEATADWPERAVIYWHVDHGRRLHELVRLRWRDVRESHAIIESGRKLRLSLRFDHTIHENPRKEGRVLPFGTTSRAYQRFRTLTDRAQVRRLGIDVLRQHHS